MNIGADLKDTRDKKTVERVARRSAMLSKFIQEDCVNALREDIEKGGSGYAPLLPPQEIRYLFQAPLTTCDKTPYNDPNDTYASVWRALDDWADSENLSINTGVNLTKGGYSRPWADYDWGGYLSIKSPKPVEPVKPVRPTPPKTRFVEQGADISWRELCVGISIGIAFMVLLFVFKGPL